MRVYDRHSNKVCQGCGLKIHIREYRMYPRIEKAHLDWVVSRFHRTESEQGQLMILLINWVF